LNKKVAAPGLDNRD